MDCHVHVDSIKIRDPDIAKQFRREAGAVRWAGGTIAQHVRHIEKDNLELIFAIYEDPQSILALRNASLHCDIRAMFFIRDVGLIDLARIASLHQQNLLQAIKLHPVIDNYELSTKNLVQVLQIARLYNLPILYHSDDRRPFMHLTAPDLQEQLIRENPDIVFIVGHGGAYAHPRICGTNPSAESYWKGSKALYPRTLLVNRALELVLNNDNAYYDLSVSTNPIKAALIAEFLHRKPDAAEKILVGTDFPIGFASAKTQLYSLEKAGLKDALLEKIASNRL